MRLLCDVASSPSRRRWRRALLALILLVPPLVPGPDAAAQGREFLRPPADPRRESRPPLEAPRTRATSTARVAAFEDPNVLLIEQDKICTRSDQSGTETRVVVEGEKILPAYATAATVFHNGWELRYLGKDHHVAQIQSEIFRIRKEGNVLRWGATGHIRDKNFDDGYEWCYHYVVVAWNQAVIDAIPQDEVPTLSLAFSAQRETALVSAAAFKGDLRFVGKATATALPEGFLFDWGGDNFLEAFPKLGDVDQEDHHLLQVAYSMGPSALYIEFGKTYDTAFAPAIPTAASRVDDGFVSWESHAIFKDNSGKRKFLFMDRFSGLAGNSVGVVYPPFSIHPVEDAGAFTGCITGFADVKTTEHVIENIPFQYAWPVLSGWNLSFECEDQHVTQLGIFLHDISYAAGVLRYKVSSILRDKNSDPGFGNGHQVFVLGFNRITGGSPTGAQPAPGR
jgi:hypothetical protein